MTFVASCGLGQCLQSHAEEPLAKHAPIPASITRASAINIIIEGACLFLQRAQRGRGEGNDVTSALSLWSTCHRVGG